MEILVLKIIGVLKIIFAPLALIFFGGKYSEYSEYFDKHIEQIVAVTVGTTVGIHETVSQGIGTPNEILFLPIILSIVKVAAKSLVAVVVSFYATKGLKKLHP
jgi:hypothetical protein